MGSVLVSGSAELGVGGVGLGRLNASKQLFHWALPLQTKKIPINTAPKYRDVPSCYARACTYTEPQTLYIYIQVIVNYVLTKTQQLL